MKQCRPKNKTNGNYRKYIFKKPRRAGTWFCPSIDMFCHPKMEANLNASPQLIANVTRY